MIPRQITMSLDRQNRAYKTCQHGTAELFTSSGQKPFDFRPSWQMKINIINYYQDNYTIYRQPRGRNGWGSWQIDTRRHYHLIF